MEADIYERVKHLHEAQAGLDELKRIGSYGMASKLTCAQIRIRLPQATWAYWRQPWNVVDCLNYLLCVSI